MLHAADSDIATADKNDKEGEGTRQSWVDAGRRDREQPRSKTKTRKAARSEETSNKAREKRQHAIRR